MTSYLYNVDMAKEKLTVYLDPRVARVLRVSASRRRMRDSEVVEEALREWLGIAPLERIRAQADMDPDEAMALALEVQAEVRRDRREGRPPTP